jgi:hypothetical protein
MSLLQRSLRSLAGFLLGLLVVVISGLAAHQAAIATPVHRTKAAKVHAQHGLAFHKLAMHKAGKAHPIAPVKHRRTRAHRVSVVKIATPSIFQLPYVAVSHYERAPLPLESVYRYVFFREITPPPPKAC